MFSFDVGTRLCGTVAEYADTAKPEEGGEASDLYFELTKGVLPVVDRVIDLGIADPRRLGLMGGSFGGFTTFGLITQTERFKAAIASAGITDLVSLYGTFEADDRYESDYHMSDQVSQSETGTFRLVVPPWNDYDRYRRNSPISYVGRVRTPLMIIHGDMDGVAIQQAEQFFTALERQNRRVRFVRYWGEGHVIASPANIRDMWQQIYRWFDEFLKPQFDKQQSRPDKVQTPVDKIPVNKSGQ